MRIPLEAIRSAPLDYDSTVAMGKIVGQELELSNEAYRKIYNRWIGDKPTVTRLLSNFSKSIGAWVAAGLPIVTKETLEERGAKCEACEHWTGWRCLICGCTELKHWLATERCPLGKWSS